tara:strand:- start:74 stop:247 length:174 start_codon:yes stop_codon:yes gene_type:complete
MSRYYKRVMKAEMLEYMVIYDIGYEEAYHYFTRMGRRPLQRTMQAVRKEVERWKVEE